MYLEISLVSVSLLFVTSCYIIWNLNRKVEIMEGWIARFSNRLIKTSKVIREVDYKGYFEEDDETGQIFNQIKEAVNELINFEGEEK